MISQKAWVAGTGNIVSTKTLEKPCRSLVKDAGNRSVMVTFKKQRKGGVGGSEGAVTLGPADGVHEDVVVLHLLPVVLKLPPQTQELLL